MCARLAVCLLALGFAAACFGQGGPPIISSQPASQTVLVGQSVTFSVTVSSSTAVSYQWFKDGVSILGATSPSLNIVNVTANDAGSYAVIVSNSSGSVISSSAVLTVSTASAPQNDAFDNRIMISGSNVTVTGSNVGATKQTGEPNHAGNSGGRSVWWTWTAPASGTVPVDTIGSDFDTLLAIYTGNSVSSLILVASDDDSGGNQKSRVTFTPLAGTTYQIAVDGFGGASGSIVLSLGSPPPNDAFADRIVISGTNVTVTGSNAGATKEAGEPNHADPSGGRSVWWTWTAPARGTASMDTIGSAFDTVLAIYAGNSVSNLTLVVSDDDSGGSQKSRVTFSALAGTTYHIAVDGFGGASGSIVLNLRLSIEPVIRYVNSLVIVTTLAGSGSFGSADGTGANAGFNFPNGAFVDETGNIYIADAFNHRIRKVSPAGVVTTLAGTGVAGLADGPPTNAQFNLPLGITVDASGNVFVADAGNNCIRKIASDGMVSTVAGSREAGYTDGLDVTARFDFPNDLVMDRNGNLYVSEFNNHTVRKISPEGMVSTWAGGGTPGYADGNGEFARFNQPGGIGVDADGNLFVTEWGNQRIRKINPNAIVSTIAGNGQAGYVDGIGEEVRFNNPDGIVVDGAGNLFITEYGNHAIRRISPSGVVQTVAGTGSAGFFDGTGATSQFFQPSGIGLDSMGNLYVADWANHRVRKITFNTAPTLTATLDRTQSPRVVQVLVTGASERSVLIQVSADLLNWTPLVTLTNLAGTVSFTDLDSANLNQRFYRAVSP